MAKLSARGRKEVFRVFKLRPDTDTTEKNRSFRVLMSDRTILEKLAYHDKPDSPGASLYGGSNSHGSHWTVRAKLAKDCTIEKYLENLLTLGWKVVV